MSVRQLRQYLFLAALLTMPPAMAADYELVVIVNASVDTDRLSREEIVNIFMGRYRKLPNGKSIAPLDIGGDSLERREFYKKLLDKNLADINAYWARLTFSGRTTPPTRMKSQAEVLETVASNRSAIGYIEKKNLDERVKAVFVVPEQ